jgi:ribosomal protein L11 methyltransferase
LRRGENISAPQFIFGLGSETMSDWIEVVVPVAAAEVDEIASLIADEVEAARAGTEIRGDEVVFWAPLERGEEVALETRAAMARLAARGAGVDPARVRTQSAVPEAEWRDAWKKYFHVTHIGRRTVVVPSWESHEAAAGEIVVELDPGMAFGTGTHASTRLVLEELERLADDGAAPAAVLDVGAGSGILAIAACKTWPAARALAIDVDPVAVRVCVENCEANAVGARVTSAVTPLEEVTETFPLVLANIQAHVLRALQAALIARAAPGAVRVMSGILTTQVEAVVEEFVAAGLERIAIRPSTDDPAWSSAVLRRP